jgi:RND family efflux transporter MFP subunit
MLARVTNARTSKLAVEGWATKQQGDTDRLTFEAQTAAVRLAEANLKAQQAAVGRLEELTSFERVVAPFNGVITSRQIDVGSLVTADTSTGTPLFAIDRSDVRRVQVYVPQDSVFALKDGQQAQVTVPEMPNRGFDGKVARNANSLQPGTRTLLTGVDLDNSSGELRAGLCCTIRLSIPRQEPIIAIPSQAVVFDDKGLSAAIDDNGIARLRHLDLARDDGADLEVRSGLNPGDRVPLSPPIDLTDGMKIKPVRSEQPARTSSTPNLKSDL